MEDHVIITIARGYGSGGKTVGRMLAKELGINCYDREIIRMASEESGINEKYFNLADEKLKKTLMHKLMTNVYSGELISPESEDFVSDDNLFNFTAKVLKDLAEVESYVAIGRCADFVLRDNPDVISVFVHAPMEYCIPKAMERLYKSAEECEKYIRETDQYRGNFYRYYTGHTWNDAYNYDLCLDSSKLGFQGCVDAIRAYMAVRAKYKNAEK